MKRPGPLPPVASDTEPAGEGSGAVEREEAAPVIVLPRPAKPAKSERVRPPTSPAEDHPKPSRTRTIAKRVHGAATADADTLEATADSVGVTEAGGMAGVWRAARARRRAERAEMRRFTARRRRRRRVQLITAAGVIAVLLGTLGAAYSPLFAVEKIEIVGTKQLSATEITAALKSQLGTPLPLIDESAVKEALVAFPRIESYALEAHPPHVLVVRVVERTPVGVISSPAGYTLVDAAGVALATTPKRPADQPILIVRGGVESRAFATTGQILRSLPESLAALVTEVSATTTDDVTLTLGKTGTTVMWGSAEDSAMKALVLTKAMKAKPPKSVRQYDVSSPSAIIIR